MRVRELHAERVECLGDSMRVPTYSELIRVQQTGKRSGELVMIEPLSEKPKPLIYASNLAEQRIKYEMQDDDSVFKKGFVVDVNVEMRRGKPVAYRVTNLHQVIDLPDD